VRKTTYFVQICVARLPKMKRHLSLLYIAQLGAVPLVTCGVQTSIHIILMFAKLPYMLELFRVSIKMFYFVDRTRIHSYIS